MWKTYRNLFKNHLDISPDCSLFKCVKFDNCCFFNFFFCKLLRLIKKFCVCVQLLLTQWCQVSFFITAANKKIANVVSIFASQKRLRRRTSFRYEISLPILLLPSKPINFPSSFNRIHTLSSNPTMSIYPPTASCIASNEFSSIQTSGCSCGFTFSTLITFSFKIFTPFQNLPKKFFKKWLYLEKPLFYRFLEMKKGSEICLSHCLKIIFWLQKSYVIY